MYKSILKPILFKCQAETAHHIAAFGLKIADIFPFGKNIVKSIYGYSHPSLPKKVMGIQFPNPIGLAAGFDKDAKHINTLSALGFGFIEIGTLTPKPQPGNDKPRLFRLPMDEALINRMGFNNEGVDAAIPRLKKKGQQVIVGGNIGKNKITPNEQATEDYVYGFEKLFPYVDYFVVNVSSPNTPGLRALQDKEPLQKLLQTLQDLNQQKSSPKPLLLKIAPDLGEEQLVEIAEIVKVTHITGIIATNTTISRQDLRTPFPLFDKLGAGGLSGKPLTERSRNVVKKMRQLLGKEYVIIGVGGIHSPQDAKAMLEAGADLIQLYTGFIYEGPAIIQKINKSLAQ